MTNEKNFKELEEIVRKMTKPKDVGLEEILDKYWKAEKSNLGSGHGWNTKREFRNALKEAKKQGILEESIRITLTPCTPRHGILFPIQE